MQITIKPENKEDEKMLGAKIMAFKNVTDYALVTRSQLKTVITGEGYSRQGQIPYLVGRLHSAIFELEDLYRRLNPN